MAVKDGIDKLRQNEDPRFTPFSLYGICPGKGDCLAGYAGLDPTTCIEINNLINEVQERYHTSAIIITHDLTCAKETGDTMAMMLDGKFVKQGSFEEVFTTDDERIKSFFDYNFIQG